MSSVLNVSSRVRTQREKRMRLTERFVVEAERQVGVLDELVETERSVVRLHNGVRDLEGESACVVGERLIKHSPWAKEGRTRWRAFGRGTLCDHIISNAKDQHHCIRSDSLPQLRQQIRTQARSRATTKRVHELEALEHVCLLGLLARDIHDAVHELGALGVVALGEVVAGARLASDKVVRPEELAERATSDMVQRARLEVDLDGAGHVLAFLATGLKEDANLLELVRVVAHVLALVVKAVLAQHARPERRADLVAGLTDGKCHKLPHYLLSSRFRGGLWSKKRGVVARGSAQAPAQRQYRRNRSAHPQTREFDNHVFRPTQVDGDPPSSVTSTSVAKRGTGKRMQAGLYWQTSASSVYRIGVCFNIIYKETFRR